MKLIVIFIYRLYATFCSSKIILASMTCLLVLEEAVKIVCAIILSFRKTHSTRVSLVVLNKRPEITIASW